MSQNSQPRKTYSIVGRIMSDLRQVVLDGYFESEKWRKIASPQLAKFPKCLLCKSGAVIVHPMGLDDATLSGQKPNELVTLCGEHYTEVTIDGEKWRSIAEANAKLRSMAHERGLHRFLRSVVAAGRDHVRERKPAFRCRICGKNLCPPHSPECGKCRKEKKKRVAR